ncbi:MAG: serine/threonine protein kinase [Eubacterium sp.]|nr:serine/threonine protein kinase [Eubacterium sp.]
MLQIGSLVDGRYKILSEIGHGGMSVVYMAINEKANKTWAVKEVRKDGTMDFNTVRAGLMAEIETLKKLNHPNLPSIVDIIEDEDSFIIVMDYIEGRSLDIILEETGAQSEANVVEWAMQLCDVFGYLHSRTPPIIYRDMKPANVMLKPDGNIKVIDFGTAKTYDVATGETTGIGTRGYAAPEQYGGLGRTDARTDIYCLGLSMYHMLTNVNPCVTLVTDKSIRAVNPALSRGLDAIILKCTQDNPDDRYQTCAELMYDLENYQNLEPLYKRKQRAKLIWFLITVFMSFVLLISGIVVSLSASSVASDNYESLMDEASKNSDYDEKIRLYEECISVPNMAGKPDAYTALIQCYKENDAVFTQKEADQIEVLVKNNKEALMEDQDAYVEICFEIGKLYWYYYDYDGNGSNNQLTRGKSSLPWFSDVVKYASEDYENLGMAKAYSGIGVFYRDISTKVIEASDRGEYEPFFKDMKSLIDNLASDENESEIVRLELLDMGRAAIQQFATKFKQDGVSYDEMLEFYTKIETLVELVDTTTDKTRDMKKKIVSNMPDTSTAIKAAYGTVHEENGG